MNKHELVAAVRDRLGPDATRRQVEETLDAVLETIATSLREREAVRLTGFGTFEARARGPRKGVDPRTGEPLRIPARMVPAFRPGSRLRDVVAGGAAPGGGPAQEAPR